MSHKSNQVVSDQNLKEMTDILWNKIKLEKYILISNYCKVCKDTEMYIKHRLTKAIKLCQTQISKKWLIFFETKSS